MREFIKYGNGMAGIANVVCYSMWHHFANLYVGLAGILLYFLLDAI